MPRNGGGPGVDPYATPWGDARRGSYELSMSPQQWMNYVAQLHASDQPQDKGFIAYNSLPPEWQAAVEKAARQVNSNYPGANGTGSQAGTGSANNGGGNAGSASDGGNGTGGPGAHTYGDGGGTNNAAIIASFLKSKGVSEPLIWGILGNLQVESSLDPTASNVKEGAIGIAQWEGGRRTALDQWAAAHGGSETDLNMQLGYLWHEMNTTESSAWQSVQGATTAGQAASLWDQYYERSSGAARQDRINYAEQYASGGVNTNISTNVPGGTGYGVAGSTGSSPVSTKTDFTAALGDIGLAGILQSVPSLRNVLQQAQQNGWSTEEFLQHIEATPWYRNHNDSAKQLIALQAHDPAEYRTRINQASAQVQQEADALGVTLQPDQISRLANQFLIEGWNTASLQEHVASLWNPNGSGVEGQAAQYTQQLKQIYSQMGLPIGEKALNDRVQQLLSGQTTLDTYTQAALTAAKSMYPSIGHQLDQGMTVKDIADPYVQTMSNLLEVDPNTLSVFSPMIKKALQGSIVNQNGKTSSVSTPLWAFEQNVRKDPRWQYTQNAHSDVANSLQFLGQSWGMIS